MEHLTLIRGLSYSHRMRRRRLTLSACLGMLCVFVMPTVGFADPVSGVIDVDTVWSGTVNVEGDVVVQCGALLTIEPGSEILFAADSSVYDDSLGIGGLCDLIVLGAMTAEGGASSADSILFDSDSATPAPGQWGKIHIAAVAVDSLCRYEYLRVAHGTLGLEVHGDVSLGHSVATENLNHGVDWSDPTSAVVLTSTACGGNGGDGLRLSSVDSLTLSGCRFEGNSGSGVYVSGDAATWVSACTWSLAPGVRSFPPRRFRAWSTRMAHFLTSTACGPGPKRSR